MPRLKNREKRKIESRIKVGSRTDVGLVRHHNEDSMIVALPLLAVADGVGGREAGEVASKIAVDFLAEHAPETPDAKALGEAVEGANAEIIEAAERGDGKLGMGTTVTAVVTDGEKMVIAQVGDSRAYRFRDGRLEQLTHDHSLVAAMVESGQLTEREALSHPSRSIITRALGSDHDMFADLYEFDMEPGDRLLLCSDGLCGVLYEEDIENILFDNPDPQRAVDRLVEAAIQAGGPDNITVIVADETSGNARNRIGSGSSKKDGSSSSRRRVRRRRIGIVVFCMMLVLLVAGAINGFLYYVNNSAYLIDQDGKVAVYSGRIEKFMGMDFSEFMYTTDIEVDDLPQITATRLAEGIQFDSIDEAYATLNSYAQQVADSETSEESGDASTDEQAASDGSSDSESGR